MKKRLAFCFILALFLILFLSYVSALTDAEKALWGDKFVPPEASPKLIPSGGSIYILELIEDCGSKWQECREARTFEPAPDSGPPVASQVLWNGITYGYGTTEEDVERLGIPKNTRCIIYTYLEEFSQGTASEATTEFYSDYFIDSETTNPYKLRCKNLITTITTECSLIQETNPWGPLRNDPSNPQSIRSSFYINCPRYFGGRPYNWDITKVRVYCADHNGFDGDNNDNDGGADLDDPDIKGGMSSGAAKLVLQPYSPFTYGYLNYLGGCNEDTLGEKFCLPGNTDNLGIYKCAKCVDSPEDLKTDSNNCGQCFKKCGECGKCENGRCVPPEVEDPCKECVCSDCKLVDKPEFASCKMSDDKEGEETGVCINKKCIRTCQGACDKYSEKSSILYKSKGILQLRDEDLISKEVIGTCEAGDDSTATKWREEFEALPLEKQKEELNGADSALKLIYGSLWWEIKDFISNNALNGKSYCDKKQEIDPQYKNKQYCLCYSKFLCKDSDIDNYGIEGTNWVNCPGIGGDCWDYVYQNNDYMTKAENIKKQRDWLGGVFFDSKTLGAILAGIGSVSDIEIPEPENTNPGIEENSSYRNFCFNKLPYGWLKGEKVDLEMCMGPCKDGIDNDCNGKVDCADESCSDDVLCRCAKQSYEASLSSVINLESYETFTFDIYPQNPDIKIEASLKLNDVEYKKGDSICGYPKSIDINIKLSGWYDNRFFVWNILVPDTNAFLDVRKELIKKIPEIVLESIPPGDAIYSNEEVHEHEATKKKDVWTIEEINIHTEIQEDGKKITVKITDRIKFTDFNGKFVGLLAPRENTGGFWLERGSLARKWGLIIDEALKYLPEVKDHEILNKKMWAYINKETRKREGKWTEEEPPTKEGYIRIKRMPTTIPPDFNELEKFEKIKKECCAGTEVNSKDTVYMIREYLNQSLEGTGYNLDFKNITLLNEINKKFIETSTSTLPTNPIIIKQDLTFLEEFCDFSILSEKEFELNSSGGEFVTSDGIFKINILPDTVNETKKFSVSKINISNCDYERMYFYKILDVETISEGSLEGAADRVNLKDVLMAIRFYKYDLFNL